MLNRVEQIIQEAIQEGHFDNLPGFGKPLKLDDLSAVPEELRPAYRILKNSGFLPPELEIHSELLTLETLLNVCQDEDEKRMLRRKRNAKLLQFEMLMERRRRQAIPVQYWVKIQERLTGSEKQKQREE